MKEKLKARVTFIWPSKKKKEERQRQNQIKYRLSDHTLAIERGKHKTSVATNTQEHSICTSS